jgi:putative FmdB family regulatory protein
MSRYDYECTKCGHTFELEQKISAAPRKRCPKCRGKVIRLISGGGGALLKGKGFYSTDYRSESYKKAARADDAGHSGSTTGGKKKDD